jgi:TatD DNase family protein
MYIDSHCHIDFADYADKVPQLLAEMAANQVSHAMVISVTLEDWPRVLQTAAQADNLFATVGVHPDYLSDDAQPIEEATVAGLARASEHPKVKAIGETGLDYYRLEGDLAWQRERFRTHIRAAREVKKPLVIHTRNASVDTLKIMREEKAHEAGGVMHCFTETWEVAQAAMDMGFYISFSGIVTFKTAVDLKAVAKQMPLASMLIETDSPYLAPVPHRGRTNQPAWVKHVAEHIATLRETTPEAIGQSTTANFFKMIGHSHV